MALWPRTQLVWLPNKDGADAIFLTLGDGMTTFSGVSVSPGLKGFDQPTFNYSYTESPGLDGAHLNRVRVPSRELFIPIYIEGDDRGDFLAKKRSFLQAMSPLGTAGAGQLHVGEGDSSVRYINAYYLDGAEGDEGINAAGFHWCKYGLRFLAFDPFFYGAEIQTATFRGDATELIPFFSSPFLGLHLTQSQSFNGSTFLNVAGDADCYPVWKLNGPMDTATLTNVSSGLSFTLNYGLLTGETAIIDTTPGQKTAKLDDGTNIWNYLGPNPQLWPVAPYANEIDIQVTGITSATEVVLEYRPRFLSA